MSSNKRRVRTAYLFQNFNISIRPRKVRGAYPTILAPLLLIALPLQATPLQDQQKFREHYRRLFPQLELSDYANGVYAIDPVARESWSAIEEFPPYQAAIEEGEKSFNTPFPQTRRHYADCFPEQGIGIAQRYPIWDKEKGEVVTLAKALNDCRESNLEKPLDDERGEITQLLAYMAYTSRGNAIDTVIPDDDPRALAAYQQGKGFYYSRQGQLNFACATCHVQNAGKRLRSEILSASLGHTNNWPTYRLKWGEIGTLHRRFRECLTQIKAEVPPAQSPILSNLEYFISYMSNGVPITGPSTRK